MLLVLAVICLAVGWGATEFQHRDSRNYEYVVATEMSRFKAYNDVYRTNSGTPGSAGYEHARRSLLLNTVKSVHHLLQLSIPGSREVLPSDYKTKLTAIASEAMALLGIESHSEFRNAIAPNGGLESLTWAAENTDRSVLVQVLDPKTEQLKPDFAEFLDTLFEIEE